MDNADELVINFVTAQNGHTDYYAGRNIAAEMQAIEDAMYGVAKGSEKMGQATENGTKKIVRLRSEMKKTTTEAQLLSRAFKWVGGFFAVNKLKDYADDWTQITSQLRLLTDTEEERVALQQKLFDISQNTRNATKETVDLYTKLTMNAQSLNLSQEKRLQLTELINKSLVAGGGSAEDNKRVLLQFGQALGIGRFQGQDLKAILQSNIGFAKTIAEGLGVDVGQLTEMGSKGELTSERVVNAIFKQQDAINAKFGKTSATIKQSLGMVNDSFMKYIGETDESLGITQKFAKALQLLAENIKLVSTVMTYAFLPSLLRATPILGAFIKGAGKGYSAMTVFKRGLVTAIPILKSFGNTLKLALNIYALTVFLKLIKEVFNVFAGKENIFELFWLTVFDKIEERMGKLPDKFSDMLEQIGLIISDWISNTTAGKYWDKFWGGVGNLFSETGKAFGKPLTMEERVNLMKMNDKTFGESRFVTPEQAQKYWAGQNITQNQNFNITVNESSQGLEAAEALTETAIRQSNLGVGMTPFPQGY